MEIAATRARISDLVMRVHPIPPSMLMADVADLFLADACRDLLCLPIVRDGVPLGTISRYAIMKIFLRQFGREIFGTRPIERFMNSTPLLVNVDADVEAASAYVRENMILPVTEDFIIVEQGMYRGMGMVTSLLALMEQRVAQRGHALVQANQRIKASQAHLVQSEKMASLGQMVAGVAHEINTPLGYVRSNVELARDFVGQTSSALVAASNLIRSLLDDRATDDEIGAHLATAASATESVAETGILEDIAPLFDDTLHGIEQISELVVNLRNFSRLDRARVDRINLNEALESALTIGRNLIKHKADVISDYGELPPVECAASQINQVFLNILTNAAQAISDYGQIVITTRPPDAMSDGPVEIRIRDNGCGMPETVRARIFDPFFTTKPVGEGTGLGLSICYQIIEQHHGSIDVSSVPGEGTEFVIRLPVHQRAGVTEPTAESDTAVSGARHEQQANTAIC
ncbi:hypothetical protein K8B33_07630 [Alcanivorax sp. JB21]|uniref:sensor histidine kinase n=1 Tax=Alcanivorax limicola TaxID=2874102 RepID=UPI001CBE55E6|nr:ATP-binding protein [Alcanivorax limicola]MBZ2188962.1 hypothetical protein [Alcanivorax limicola]